MTDLMRDRVVAAVGDRYDVQAELGRGGTAVVYRALDVRLRRSVAIKVLPPELAYRDDVRARFLREAQTAAQLAHPHIVPIYTVDEADGLVFFVMGLVEGESLGARLLREPRPPVAFVTRVLAEAADALAFAHRRGVVHRDIKPDNILLDRDTQRAIVTDFGIARALEEGARLTLTGIAVGTPAFMSPEQALGERDVDGRSDIYALGVLGYLMLAGELPFRATNTPAMLMKHISEPPPSLA
ncbi:MAG TPA: serine/threonine-protein kinase, partial [Gemmatimonadaceae bacterium]|nr:serine/threonine-protein kinase [Gemmatimonadaceae bacterium]